MKEEFISYQIDGGRFIGYLVIPDGENGQRRPGIVIAHAWLGQDEFAREKARALAKLGYVALAADLYGERREVSVEQAPTVMMPLFQDRELLQTRIKAAFDLLRQRPEVDASQMGAIGFCFGGLTAIELFRSGVDVKGVVSFHGILGSQMGGQQAQEVPIVKNIKGSLLVLHGYEDPLVSQEDIQAFQQEMTAAHIDWQMTIYSQTAHAFTNPQANDIKHGLRFNPKSSARAWLAMQNFFQEVFSA